MSQSTFEPTKTSHASLLIVFITIFIDLVGFGIIIPILQPYAKNYGATDFQAGILMGLFSLVQFFVIPVWGWLSDVYGRRPIILLGLLGTVFSYLLLAFSWNLSMVFLGRILAGLCSGNLVAAQAYVADITTHENRAHGMGIIGIAFGLGFIFGPVIGSLLSHIHVSFPFYAAAGFSMMAFLFGYFLLEESLPPEKRLDPGPMRHPILDFSKVIADIPVLRVVLSNFLFMVSFSMWETVLVLFVMRKVLPGVETKEISASVGYLFAMAGILSAIIQGTAIRPLAKHFREHWLSIAGLFCLVLGNGGFIWFWNMGSEGSISGLIPSLVLIGTGLGLFNPSISSIVSKLVSPQRQGEVFGAFRGVGSLGRVVGPLAGAYTFAAISPAAPYTFSIVLLAGAMALSYSEFDYFTD